MVECRICSDSGVCLYKKIINGNEYIYASHCTCKKRSRF
jgi:hypothetical protein